VGKECSPLPFPQLITSQSQSWPRFLAFSFTIHNQFPYRIPEEKFSAPLSVLASRTHSRIAGDE